LELVLLTVDGQPGGKRRPEGSDLHSAAVTSLVAQCPPDAPRVP
jgi:hypothetical protein